jgi:hypothetical protein
MGGAGNGRRGASGEGKERKRKQRAGQKIVKNE